MASLSEMKSACPNLQQNLEVCTCTYEPCSRKGLCCQCIAYHKKMGEMPGCLFSTNTERTYDRSTQNFIRSQK